MLQSQNKWEGFSILIPFHHRHDLLFPLLQSLRDIPVLVVDDGDYETLFSSDIERIRGNRKGFAAAVNTGLAYLQKREIHTVLIMNDDVQISKADIEKLWKERSKKTIVSPVIHCNGAIIYGATIKSWGRVLANHSALTPSDAIYGTCMMLPSSLRFDEQYRHGFEDLELCLRMVDQGYEIKIVEDAHCYHLGGGSLSTESMDGQRWATYGQLRLYSSLRKAPLISLLSLSQVVRENGDKNRYVGFVKGIVDWLYKDCFSLAARIASSKGSSSKAK